MAEVEEVEMAKERGDAVIDIEASIEIVEEGTTGHDDHLPDWVQQKLDAVPGEPLTLRSVTIFRAPSWFHEADKMYYDPKVVSLGPYHHRREELRAMEEYKWSTLRDFLARNNKVNFNTYLGEIRTLETKARLCYSESVSMTSDEFVMMLALDGCFILEFFLKQKYGSPDAILNTSWSSHGVVTDMLLLENQMPFFIIHKLFAIYGDCPQWCEDCCPLLELIYRYQESFLYKQKMGPPQEPCSDIQHLLHLFYSCMVHELQIEESNLVQNQSRHLDFGIFSRLKSRFLPQLIKRAKEKAEEEDEEEESGQQITVIPCVSDLHAAGVTFKRKRKPRHMLDISFENGIMEIPSMKIDTSKKIILTNIVAFEQRQHLQFSQSFSSYMALMDALVNTEKDVALLQECGILENLLQNEEDAAKFFNHFGDFNCIDYDDHYFQGLFIKVRKYSESTWHKYRAKLMNDYFNNPWAIISVVAGGVLLILSAVQTYYTVYSSVDK